MLSQKVKTIAKYTAGEQLNSPDIIKLNSNENPYLPPDEVTNISVKSLMLNKYPNIAADALRAEVAKMHNLNPQNVFMGNGSDEVLAFCYLAFFDKDKYLAHPAISYSFYPVWAQLYDIKCKPVPMKSGFEVDVDKFLNLKDCCGIILANPNAPTTLALDLEEIEKILKTNPDIAVIVDEAYIDFGGQSADVLIKKYPNLVVVRTFSKGWSLAGIRCGYALAQERAIEALATIRDCFNSYTLDSVAQAVCLNAVRNRQYMIDNCKKVIATRERVKRELTWRGYKVLDSKTNFLFFTRPGFDPKKVQQALKQKNILIRYFDKAEISQYLRLTIGTDAQMDAFLKELKEADNF